MVPTVRKNHVQTAPRMPTLSAVARTTLMRVPSSPKRKSPPPKSVNGLRAIRRSDRHSGYCSSLFDFPVPHLRSHDENQADYFHIIKYVFHLVNTNDRKMFLDLHFHLIAQRNGNSPIFPPHFRSARPIRREANSSECEWRTIDFCSRKILLADTRVF
jgi:hypothetical protein